MSKAFTLDSTYVNLRPDDSATTLKIGPRFWTTVGKRTDLDDGRLMGTTPQKADWPHWERALAAVHALGARAIRAYPAQWGMGPHDSRLAHLAGACGRTAPRGQ